MKTVKTTMEQNVAPPLFIKGEVES